MHFSGSNANISFRCPCACCCLSRIHRQKRNAPFLNLALSWMLSKVTANTETRHQLQWAVGNSLKLTKIKQSNSPWIGSQERFIFTHEPSLEIIMETRTWPFPIWRTVIFHHIAPLACPYLRSPFTSRYSNQRYWRFVCESEIRLDYQLQGPQIHLNFLFTSGLRP